MIIKVKNGSELTKLLDNLANDLVTANIHLKMVNDLMKTGKKYADEFNQSGTFWYLTLTAHRDVVHFRLCRAYDQHGSALNLRNLLDTIEANTHLFKPAHFRERLKANPHVDSLAATNRIPQPAQLEADKRYVSARTNPLVKKLMLWRGNHFAHRSPEPIVGGKPLSAMAPFPSEEVEELATRGMEIINRYSDLYLATAYSTDIIGRDDFENILRAVREHLVNLEKRVAADMERWKSAEQAAQKS